MCNGASLNIVPMRRPIQIVVKSRCPLLLEARLKSSKPGFRQSPQLSCVARGDIFVLKSNQCGDDNGISLLDSTGFPIFTQKLFLCLTEDLKQWMLILSFNIVGEYLKKLGLDIM